MELNYFDLGLHKEAKEIDMFVKLCNENNIKYNIYGVEAHPQYCLDLKEKHKENINIKIINKAINDKNQQIKLYINYSFDGEGNSIFSTKHNVTKEYVWVEGIKFSDLIQQIRPTFKRENNILRFNIEGAEWHLINDLDKSGLFKYFKVMLGTNDLHKVGELKNKIDPYLNILTKNQIKIERYCGHKPKSNVDLLKLIKGCFQ